MWRQPRPHRTRRLRLPTRTTWQRWYRWDSIAEEAGIDECILYFNVGKKPHGLVKDQMYKFMEEVAPNFETYQVAAE